MRCCGPGVGTASRLRLTLASLASVHMSTTSSGLPESMEQVIPCSTVSPVPTVIIIARLSGASGWL